jgi:hypothetical protein
MLLVDLKSLHVVDASVLIIPLAQLINDDAPWLFSFFLISMKNVLRHGHEKTIDRAHIESSFAN